ncbi:tetratricopeptide repeat protein, partial [Escherichia coli]|uniref:tetratricopeptide repeat protein n=1 Tax=Escherichia coli TaxID=562 RepID=UPI0013D258BF
MEDATGAIEDYTKAIELNPNNANIYYNRGVEKEKLKDFQGALADYNKALVLNPRNTAVYFNRGVVRGQL